MSHRLGRTTLHLTLLFSAAFSQVGYNHPEIAWKTFETKHFYIHFSRETERSAREGAFVAESIYPHVTQFYDYEPPVKTHIIFLDTDDVSNGIAYAYDNKIEIWASPLDFELRGSHRWLQNVITHEFTHIVSIQKAMKFGRSFPGAYLQWIGYEDYKRKDVLYGYPQTLASYPIPGLTVPPWLAEGTAQYLFEGSRHDFWDTHRDMILRDAVLNGNLLSFTEINTFGKRGIGNELTYNTGFAFVRFIAYKYGDGILMEILDHLARPFQFSVDSAIKKAVGVSGSALYEDFKQTLEDRYRALTGTINTSELKGKILLTDGTTNIHPKWSPGADRIAYLSNAGNDFFSQTGLFIYSLEDGRSEKIADVVISAPSWASSGDEIYYARKAEPDLHGSRWYDLYEYSFEEKKESRLTRGARTFSPVLLPGDSLLAYLSIKDGTHNVFLINLKTKESEKITNFDDGEQLFGLAYDSTHEWLMFDYVYNHFRNTATLSLGDTSFSNLLATEEWDERDVTSTPAGGLIYACDRSGIFNLCYINPADGSQGFITNVLGGAFMPDVNGSGKIVYSLFEDGGYKIAVLDSMELIDSERVGYGPNYYAKFANLPSPLDTQNRQEAVPYEDHFSPMFIFPKIMMDYGMLKPGLYFYSSEIVNRLNVFGGASVNLVRDLDLFLLFEFRNFYPTLFTEVYFLTRHISEKSKLMDVYDFDVDVLYRLFQLDSGIRIPIRGVNELKLYASYQNYRASANWLIGAENVLTGKSGVNYYVGKHLGARWTSDVFRKTIDYDINPNNGFQLDIDLRFEDDSFLNSDSSVVDYVYDHYDFFRLTGQGALHVAVPGTERWTITGELRAGWMSHVETDSFFFFFGGGMPGIKGYPFYSIAGNRMALGSLTLRIPLMRGNHYLFGPLILQNIVLGIIGQTGDAWDSSNKGRFSPKKSAGIQLRLGGFSFYNYPTGIGVEMHRGLDNFKSLKSLKTRYYFTLLFGF
ncbi:MAG: hypothetical protein V3U24_01185 [Candidatus Neomarinimicrobiota bacterium]